MKTLTTRTICQRHGFRATVGSAVQFALDYYECPACVREQDAEYARSQRPCCSRANIDCCGHDDPDYPDTSQWPGVEIETPNFCDHSEIGFFGCSRPACPHPGCLERQAQEPPF